MPSTTESNAASDTRAVSTSGACFSSRRINSSSVIRVEAMVLAFRFFRAIPAPQTAMLAAVACWRVVAEAAASEAYSASCYDLIEDIGILPVVESECKLIEVQGQILFRHLVVIADDAPFQERPERFNRLRVNATAHTLRASASRCHAGILADRDGDNDALRPWRPARRYARRLAE